MARSSAESGTAIERLLRPGLTRMSEELAEDYPAVFLIPGNDDPGMIGPALAGLENDGLIYSMHQRGVRHNDYKVTPSQGTHFFQNLHTYEVGYFTINTDGGVEFLDWDWLLEQSPRKKRRYTRALRFEQPILIKMSGHTGEGAIFKPGLG